MTKTLITGASSGIGATYADRLSAAGHDLVLVARDLKKLEALADRLSARDGTTVQVFPADLGSPADLHAVERRIHNDPEIDGLINNAGISIGGSFESQDPERIEDLIDLNITALTRLSAAAAAVFTSRGHGTIINIGSVTALLPERFEPTYLASKAYVLALTQALAAQLKDRGVRVQAVLPGATRTDIWAKSGVDVDSLPAGMVMGVEDMVDAALAGLAQGETVTIPALPDAADWQALETARLALGPNLSRDQSAMRYGVRPAVAA
ncbi:MAG: SDR family oxidoreductase [Caulobacter sp.]|nr:SDR family oxidoreductase [Caulobacter sp.]